ncbi:MAG: hypothetical protein LUH13_03150 [Oscillospiraceae bacterium]|nr:hypothetical protein [Oscillospiraceae bacterium]
MSKTEKKQYRAEPGRKSAVCLTRSIPTAALFSVYVLFTGIFSMALVPGDILLQINPGKEGLYDNRIPSYKVLW